MLLSWLGCWVAGIISRFMVLRIRFRRLSVVVTVVVFYFVVTFLQSILHQDMTGIDSSIIASPSIWEASGHVAGFSDPMVSGLCSLCVGGG